MQDTVYWKYNSKWGEMVIGIDKVGALKGLWFTGQKYFPKIDERSIYEQDFKLDAKERMEAKCLIMTQLNEYENGIRKVFDIKIEPEGTDFQKEVWDILLSIPYGETSTYGEISTQIAKRMNKKSMSAQAVGQAVGHNPISVIVPCHRVIGKKGELTGYAGGVEKKIALLELEGVIKD
jgi:methylated-DNA-[protein]-cysteine S-methyltransferase